MNESAKVVLVIMADYDCRKHRPELLPGLLSGEGLISVTITERRHKSVVTLMANVTNENRA